MEPKGNYAFSDFSFLDLSHLNLNSATFLKSSLYRTNFSGSDYRRRCSVGQIF